jgi:hypothetical protein
MLGLVFTKLRRNTKLPGNLLAEVWHSWRVPLSSS